MHRLEAEYHALYAAGVIDEALYRARPRQPIFSF
jgi:hypothetical protein